MGHCVALLIIHGKYSRMIRLFGPEWVPQEEEIYKKYALEIALLINNDYFDTNTLEQYKSDY